MSERCLECGAIMKCAAGESAHPSNWHCPQCNRITKLQQEVERLLMSRARKDAMLAVYMQAIAARARNGEEKEWAQQIVRKADEAALRVKRSDLTVATVNAEAKP